MVTNGMLLTRSVARRIIQTDWKLVQVSLDAPVPEVHNRLRQHEKAFSGALAAIHNLVEEKKRQEKDTTEIQINMVLTSLNQRLLTQMVRFASSRGCQKIKFIPMVISEPGGRLLEIPPRSFNQLKDELCRAREMAEAVCIETNLSELEGSFSREMPDWGAIFSTLLNRKEGYPLCFSPWWALRISSDGWATCCASSTSKLIRVHSHTLRDIWHCDAFETMRKQIMSAPVKDCKDCCYVAAADNLSVTGALEEESPQDMLPSRRNSG